MVVTTLLLMLGVGIGTLVLGGGLAWLVTAYTFPLRDCFVWLLVLPLAMPAYILGFVFLSTFDEAGPVQQALRAVLGDGAGGRRCARSAGCVVVMSLTLYPYVYLLARAAFVEQGSRDVRRRPHARGRPAAGRSSGCCCRSPGRRWPPAWRW